MASTSSSRTSGGTQGSSGDGKKGARGGFASFTADSDADREALATSSSTDAKSASSKGGGGTGGAAKSGAGKSGTGKSSASRTGRGPRRIRLTLARLDPFSVMKLSFLIALAIGIATVICTALLWGVVDGIGLWDKMNSLASDLNNGKPLKFMEFFEFSKMISYSVIIAFVNLVIITALGTLFAFLYNIVAGLLGGLKMTFTDE
ncbi:DUF3566 domain-containing protein [Brachybacterium nesterenkovii]|uniref:DUF3566 domain-containing protein n=1 Tax=Brachybacterium nesterenkovii TaxID=47847 RepID=A0A1X6X3U3_9MICO|nr:DUF3566 domain-containing protein [Brachybacterium nesterenkovii]SLM93527.1 hypothetical protein FM110_10015 [Brachybacterium nesterenkovii]